MKGKTTWILILCCLGLTASPLHGSIDEDSGDDDDTQIGRKSRAICSDLFSQLAGQYQNALVAISDRNIDAAVGIIRQNEFSDDQKLLLWRLLVSANADAAREAFAVFKFEGEMLESILMEIIAINPDHVRDNFSSLAHTEEDKFRIAKLLAERTPIGGWVRNFGIRSEAQRAELAIISIANVKGDYMNHWSNYGLTDASLQARIVAALMLKGHSIEGLVPKSFSELQRDASLESRYEVAKSMAVAKFVQHNDSYLSQILDWSNGFSDDQKVAVSALWLAKHIDHNGWSYIDPTAGLAQLYLLSSTDKSRVLLGALENVTRVRLREREARDNALFRWFNGRLNSLFAAAPQIRKLLFRKDGMHVIAESNHVEDLDHLNLLDDSESVDLTRALTNFAKDNPDLLPEKFIGLLWEDVRNRDVAVTLLREYLSQNQGEFTNIPNSSLELLAQVTGLSANAISSARDLRRNPTELYELALNIQDKMAKPAFSYLPIAAEVYAKRSEFLELLKLLRDVHEQNGDGTKGWKKTLSQLGLSTERGITEQNLSQTIKTGRELLIKAVRDQLQAQNVEFSYDDFLRLEQEWGDLEPIWTLLSRFQGNSSWAAEIPVLIKIFEASLNGRFRSFKFEGDPDNTTDQSLAQLQLNGLNGHQIEEWIKPRAVAEVPEMSARDAAETTRVLAAKLEEALTTVEQKLVTAVREAGLPIPSSAEAPRAEKKFIEKTYLPRVASILRQEPHAIVDELVDLVSQTAIHDSLTPSQWLFQAALRRVMTAHSWDALKGDLRVLNSLLTFHRDLGNETTEPMKAAIRAIEKIAKPESGTRISEIVFSALTSDPKLLLTVGEVVQVTSCQNYKTGGQIYSLLAYVQDANIQAMVSFSIKMQHFSDAQDFHRVAAAIVEGRATPVFNGNKRVVTFELTSPDGTVEEVQTLNLGHGFLRQMIKYGTDSLGRPGLRTEKPYFQNSTFYQTMVAQQEALKQQVLDAMQIQNTTMPINIYRSRNPLGVYSDYGGGFKRNENYQLP